MEVQDPDHVRILHALDCSQQVAQHQMQIALLEERCREMKEDREKANKQTMWIIGAALSIILTVAGSLINSSATVKVHDEKIMEMKKEIERATEYFNQHEH